MAFQDMTNYFANALGEVASSLAITSSDENKSASTAQGVDEKGDVVAEEIFGTTTSPSCSYVLKNDVTLTGLKVGIVKDEDNHTIGSITINTNAGQAPTISISGEELPDDIEAHTDCYYELPSCTVKKCFHAQGDVLGTIYTMTGANVYLTSASYTIGGQIARATKNGSTVSYDITGGQLSATLTFQATGSATPNVTASDGWSMTSPLTKSHADASYPTWTCTLTKPLLHKTVTQG